MSQEPDNPVLAAHVTNPDDFIDDMSCSAVGGEILLAESVGGTLVVTLRDGVGGSASSSSVSVSDTGGSVEFFDIAACGLEDGPIRLQLDVTLAGLL